MTHKIQSIKLNHKISMLNMVPLSRAVQFPIETSISVSNGQLPTQWTMGQESSHQSR